MKKYDTIIKNATLVHQAENQAETTNLYINNGKIEKIQTNSQPQSSEVQLDGESNNVLDASGLLLFPGIIDSQVHFREPGLTDKEDIEHGSKGALLGGVTSYFEMPNTNPSTTHKDAIADKVKIARQTSYTNFAFYIGATRDNLAELENSHNLPGCCGIKIFLGSSTGNLLLFDPEILTSIFKNCKNNIALHSENETMLKANIKIRDEAKSVHAHYEWRDVETALSSTKMVLKLARQANKRVHVLHISTKDELAVLQEYADCSTFEVTPQHATLYAPDIYDQLDTFAQMNPPIREKIHQEAIFKSLQDNLPCVIGSDHAPHLKEEKLKGYPHSPSGMPGVQTIFTVMLDHALRGKLTLEQVQNYLCTNPHHRFGIVGKGLIKEGFDADLVLVDPNDNYLVNNEDVASKCGWTPYAGRELKGKIKSTFIAGEKVVEDGKILKRPKVQALNFKL